MRRGHRWIAPLLALLAAGCASSSEYRAVKEDEKPALGRAMTPLLRAAYGDDLSKCTPGAAVREATYFNAYVFLGEKNACDVDVIVTSAALNELTPKALQTLLAHELGHAQRRHPAGAKRATEDLRAKSATGQQMIFYTANTQYKPDEEAEADTEAARLLTLVWRGSNVGCMGTLDLYEDIAKDRRRWGHWLSRHPHPERRVEAVAKACDAAGRR
jgi:Zn-dependent protease with chaperone function